MESQPLDGPEPGHLILDPLCLAESVLGRHHRLCCPHPSLMVNTPCSLEAWKSLGRLRARRLELIGMPVSQAEIGSSDSVPISLGSCLMEQWAPWGTSSFWLSPRLTGLLSDGAMGPLGHFFMPAQSYFLIYVLLDHHKSQHLHQDRY